MGEIERCPAYSDFCSGIVGDRDEGRGDRDRDSDSGAESDDSTDRDAEGDTDREGESESATEYNDGDGDDKDGGRRAEADQSPIKGGGQSRDGSRGRQRDNDAGRSVRAVPIKMGRVSVCPKSQRKHPQMLIDFTCSASRYANSRTIW